MGHPKHTLTAATLLAVAAIGVSGCGSSSTTTSHASTPGGEHPAAGYRLGDACSPGNDSKYMTANLRCTNHHLTKMAGHMG